MNELSWLIYLAGVADNIGVMSFVVAVFGIVGGVMGLIAAYAEDEPMARKYGLIALSVGIAMAFIAVFVPAKDTVYAIAASEMGERVLQADTANKALTALNAWLDRQIAGDEDQ